MSNLTYSAESTAPAPSPIVDFKYEINFELLTVGSTRTANIGYSLEKVRSNKQKLDYFLNLPENWNNNDASKFKETLINKVRRIIDYLEFQPDIFPTAQNSIQLEYEKSNGDYLEFEIFDDRIKVFQSIKDSEKEYTAEDISEIQDLVNEFYSE